MDISTALIVTHIAYIILTIFGILYLRGIRKQLKAIR